MLKRSLKGRSLPDRLVAAVGASAVIAIGVSVQVHVAADANPVLPDINAYEPINPVDYTVMSGNWYAFSAGTGITCVVDKTNGGYGCSGPLPGAPQEANMVSGGPSGPPRLSRTSRPAFASAGEVKPLPPNTRLSFREISCGVDGGGVVACVNSRDQVGFIISPTHTVVVG